MKHFATFLFLGTMLGGYLNSKDENKKYQHGT